MSGGGGEERGCSGGGEAEDAESAYIDPDRVVEMSGPSGKFVGGEWLCCRFVRGCMSTT
ncbi:unnamed protein product [Camellia sinensis]